eukprot:3942075-Amphidinium_carterae.1
MAHSMNSHFFLTRSLEIFFNDILVEPLLGPSSVSGPGSGHHCTLLSEASSKTWTSIQCNLLRFSSGSGGPLGSCTLVDLPILWHSYFSCKFSIPSLPWPSLTTLSV